MIHIPSRYTTESVTSGHPDKICDQISDAILDAALKKDPLSRVAIETFGSHGYMMIGGEIKTNAKIDFKKIALEVYKKIGYKDNLKVTVRVAKQSNDIAMGVDTGGAGDQALCTAMLRTKHRKCYRLAWYSHTHLPATWKNFDERKR